MKSYVRHQCAVNRVSFIRRSISILKTHPPPPSPKRIPSLPLKDLVSRVNYLEKSFVSPDEFCNYPQSLKCLSTKNTRGTDRNRSEAMQCACSALMTGCLYIFGVELRCASMFDVWLAYWLKYHICSILLLLRPIKLLICRNKNPHKISCNMIVCEFISKHQYW